METLLIYLLILLVVIVPIMFMYRRHTVAKAEEEMRNQRLIQDSVLNGVKTMRGAERNSHRMPMSPRAMAAVDKDRAKPTRVDTSKPTVAKKSDDNTPDDLMLLTSLHLNSVSSSVPTPMSNYDDDTRKIAGGGGTFDGGGSSGDWGRSDPAPSAPSCDSDRYSSSSGSSSYDSGSSSSGSSSYDSGSSSSDSGSSSSDSGSSCSSD